MLPEAGCTAEVLADGCVGPLPSLNPPAPNVNPEAGNDVPPSVEVVMDDVDDEAEKLKCGGG